MEDEGDECAKEMKDHYDASSAAEAYADYWDQDDRILIDSETIVVTIDEDGTNKRFNVGAEPDIRWWSTEIKEAPK